MRDAQASVSEHHKAQALSISAVGAAFPRVLCVEKPIPAIAEKFAEHAENFPESEEPPLVAASTIRAAGRDLEMIFDLYSSDFSQAASLDQAVPRSGLPVVPRLLGMLPRGKPEH